MIVRSGSIIAQAGFSRVEAKADHRYVVTVVAAAGAIWPQPKSAEAKKPKRRIGMDTYAFEWPLIQWDRGLGCYAVRYD